MFTLTLLAATPLLAFAAYIPRRHLSDQNRKLFQSFICGLGGVWIFYRFNQRAPLDLLLIEGVSLICLNFAFATRAHEYSYLLLVAVIQFGYGAVLPSRQVYLYLLPGAGLLCLLLFYQSRAAVLARAVQPDTRRTVGWRNWPVLLGYVLLVLVVWGLLFNVMPIFSRSQAGFFGASFITRNRRNLAPRLRDWLRSADYQSDPAGRFMFDSRDPTHRSRKSSRQVTGDEGRAPGGGGIPGKDLVMRVKSPVRLYWLAALYDIYDGNKWVTSREMWRQRAFFPGGPRRALGCLVPQQFVIEKWLSPALYSAYLQASAAGLPQDLRTRRSFFGERLTPGEFYPQLPFSYQVGSYIFSGDDSVLGRWYEQLPMRHYLQLPHRQLSRRVRELAQRICKDAETPLAKAYALRDYLRQNYRYSLKTKPAPPARESVDYFLFDLKEGHCEYYASALAVLARCVRLPARVATGFGPGNYNILTGHFEVFEYHAHAWTQVFIPGKGWLTMDATPPSAPQLESRTTPLVLSAIRDPFSDEWRVSAPELSPGVRRFVKSQKELAQQRAGKPGLLARLMARLRGSQHAENKDNAGVRGADSESARPRAVTFWRRLKANIHDAMRDLILRGKRFLDSLKPTSMVIAIIICLLLMAILCLWPLIQRQVRFRRRMLRCDRRYHRAAAAESVYPPVCITACYRMLRELLALARLPRQPEEELVEYATALHEYDLEFSRDVLAVFVAWFQLQYSPASPSIREAAETFRHARQARNFLLERLGRKHGDSDRNRTALPEN